MDVLRFLARDDETPAEKLLGLLSDPFSSQVCSLLFYGQ